ncbi:MAG TPA: hypothetical protein VJB90_05610 [Candidatus Nanoarchaeia archaeon]|nr:hypothetical protein [Candidatus Nanoarchaeia archaeon]
MPIHRFVKGEFQQKILQPRVLIPIFVAILVLFLFVIPQWKSIRNIFFITLFFILGCASYFYRRFFNIRIGIEFVSVGTFLCTLAYGPGVGLFVGNASAFISEFIGSRIDERIIVNLFSTNVVVLVAMLPFMQSLAYSNLMLAALIVFTAYHGIGVGGNMLMGGNPGKTIVFVATSLFWYLAFFLRIGPLIYAAMVS